MRFPAVRQTIIPAVLAATIAVFSSPTAADEKPSGQSKTSVVKIDELALTVPGSWKQQKPSNRLRKAQFVVPAAAGEKDGAELVVYQFGGGGGGIGANIERWIGQFQSRGRKAKVTKGQSELGPYVFVDIRGTYNQPIGPPIQRKTKPLPNARMLAVILAVEKVRKVYYLKLAGTDKTISSAAADVRKAFGGDASKETELKLDGKQP